MNKIVIFTDEVEGRGLENEIRELTLDELFKNALSMNSMGYSEGYETEYIIEQMISKNKNVINYISDKYKVNLIEGWDYVIKDIVCRTNNSDTSILESINNLSYDFKNDNSDEDERYKKYSDILYYFYTDSICGVFEEYDELFLNTTFIVLQGILRHTSIKNTLNNKMKGFIERLEEKYN